MKNKHFHVFKGKQYPCCASLTMGVIGGKWKTVILYHLMDGKLRYNELRKSMPTVTERTLSLQLKKLEEDGIVNRKVYTSKPPLKVEYTLSELGKTLKPLIHAIAEWGDSAGKILEKDNASG
jgi:DNA-binding HxlR family transcriptional regulator